MGRALDALDVFMAAITGIGVLVGFVLLCGMVAVGFDRD